MKYKIRGMEDQGERWIPGEKMALGTDRGRAPGRGTGYGPHIQVVAKGFTFDPPMEHP